jgi:YjbE family integral membrane protein
MEFLSTIDWAAILKIIGIDIMLGVDNAIVIALACAALPKEVRGKAIMWGTAGAVGLRAILLVFAGFLMAIPYVKLVAGAYLLYLGYKLLVENDGSHDVPAADRVFTAVKTIIVADFMMSLDNVLAVTAAANTAGAHSTMYAIAGIVLSIPVIIFGASGLTGLMSKFPVIVWLGAGLLGWVGAEMIITDNLVAGYIDGLHGIAGHYTHLCFKAAGFMAVIAAVNVHKLLTKNAAAPAAAK